MSTSAWIFVGLGIALVLYVLSMRLFMRESRELEEYIDRSKLRPWQDAENED